MPDDLLRDLESFGLFFEDMAVCDLKIYVGTLGGDVLHYRDNAGLECDAVVHLDDGTFKWNLKILFFHIFLFITNNIIEKYRVVFY